MLRESDFLGRLGEDQFLAVLGGIQNRDLKGLAERLRDELSRRLSAVHREHGVWSRAAVASAGYPADGPTAEELVIVSRYRLGRRPAEITDPAELVSREPERPKTLATVKPPV